MIICFLPGDTHALPRSGSCLDSWMEYYPDWFVDLLSALWSLGFRFDVLLFFEGHFRIQGSYQRFQFISICIFLMRLGWSLFEIRMCFNREDSVFRFFDQFWFNQFCDLWIDGWNAFFVFAGSAAIRSFSERCAFAGDQLIFYLKTLSGAKQHTIVSFLRCSMVSPLSLLSRLPCDWDTVFRSCCPGRLFFPGLPKDKSVSALGSLLFFQSFLARVYNNMFQSTCQPVS